MDTASHKVQHFRVDKLTVNEQANPEKYKRYTIEIGVEYNDLIQKAQPIQTFKIEITLNQRINDKRQDIGNANEGGKEEQYFLHFALRYAMRKNNVGKNHEHYVPENFPLQPLRKVQHTICMQYEE